MLGNRPKWTFGLAGESSKLLSKGDFETYRETDKGLTSGAYSLDIKR